jgi:DNA-binding CsgD family transcriptional regulator
MRLTWPLTGRSEELRTVQAALSAPDTAGIIICGSAGVGKSRVAREALACAAADGCETRWVVGTSSARTIPLGAFSAWAEAAGSDSVQSVRGVVDSLTVASPGVGVVVGVDDVHLLDDLSTFVVHQIVQRNTAKVVLTARYGEPIPAGIQEIWRGAQIDRLDLQPLSADETATLLSTTLDGSVDADVATRLWKLTRGNVLYLRNIVEQEVGAGRLANRRGHWMWTADPVLPQGLVELIESRIGDLPGAVGDVIDALAVGEPIELTSLQRMADPAAVEEADARGLITLEGVERGIEVRVAHPLYGEVRRKRAAPTRLRRLRGLVSDELAASDDRDDMRVVVRRASLNVDSDREPDPDLLVRAAQGALWLADLPLAERLADAAIRAGAPPDAYFIRAHALSWLNRGEDAEAVLADVPIRGLSDTERARLAYLHANNRLFALADPAAAKVLIDEASRAAPQHARDCIDAFLTVYWFAMDEPEAALQTSKDLAFDQLPTVAGASTAWAVASVAGDVGRTTEAAAAADTGYAVAARAFDTPHARFNIADAHVTALLLAGRVAEAGKVAEGARQLAADLPGVAHALGNAVAARAALGAGNIQTACSLLNQAIQALSAPGHDLGWGHRYRLAHTIGLAMRGSCADATAALAVVEQPRPWLAWGYEVSLARAWVAACHGAVSEAVETAVSTAESVRAKGQFAAEVLCLQTATQFGEHSRASRLRELAAIVEGPRAGAATRFAEALRDGNPAELAEVSDEFERIGDLVAAADAAAHAAVVYRRRGLRGSAYGCSTRAEALADQGGGLDTPALRQAVEPLPLTDREREIVRLLCEGLSSREVAERLTLSTRTVEGHVYRAMAKTGTSSRAELASLLPRRRPN